jgi:hypothetical protein
MIQFIPKAVTESRADSCKLCAARVAQWPHPACNPPLRIYYRGMASRTSQNPRRNLTPRLAEHASIRGAVVAALAILVAITLPGCQAPVPPSGPTQIVLHVPDYDAFVDASLSVLRRYEFTPDRVDRSHGLIISQPTTSGQWFEWWRVDSLGGYQTLESSLHTTRRIVTVNIQPVSAGEDRAGESREGGLQEGGLREGGLRAGESREGEAPAEPPTGGTFRVTVQVNKSRFSAPERQVTTPSGALVLYSAKTPTTEGLAGPQSRGLHWVPLGRDGLLESFFLGKLADALPDVEPAE